MSWEDEVKELKSYFESIEIPRGVVKIDKGTWISDLKKMIETHLSYVENNIDNKAYLPYLKRLRDLKTYFENEKMGENS